MSGKIGVTNVVRGMKVSNIKGIIFNKEFEELFEDKKKIASVEIIEEAILGISALKDVLGPWLVKYNFEGKGKDDEIEFKLHLDLAVKALEKHVPKKITKTYLVNGKIYGECQNCGHTGLAKDVHENCWWCGQKLDWSGA